MLDFERTKRRHQWSCLGSYVRMNIGWFGENVSLFNLMEPEMECGDTCIFFLILCVFFFVF